MSIARPVGLIARRTIAFVLDMAILISLMGLACIIPIAAGCEFQGLGWNPLFLAGVLCYFGIFESLYSGQTPGKMMARIRVQMSTGQRVMPYQAFARISVIVLLPLVLSLVYLVLVTCRAIALPTPVVDCFTFALPYVIWPVSAIIGGGHTALHDFLTHTVVARTKATEDPRQPGVSWLYPYVVVFLASAITAVCVYRVLSRPARTLTNFLERMSGQEKLAYMQVMRAVEDLCLRIENGPEFVAGARVRIDRWTPNLWKEWSVERSCMALPDNIRNANLGFQIHVSYEIFVTERGLVSSGFQDAVRADICRRVMGPGVFITFEFVYTSQVLIFVGTVAKRSLAFMYSDVDDKGTAVKRMAILEPDHAAYIRPGVVLVELPYASLF